MQLTPPPKKIKNKRRYSSTAKADTSGQTWFSSVTVTPITWDICFQYWSVPVLAQYQYFINKLKNTAQYVEERDYFMHKETSGLL